MSVVGNVVSGIAFNTSKGSSVVVTDVVGEMDEDDLSSWVEDAIRATIRGLPASQASQAEGQAKLDEARKGREIKKEKIAKVADRIKSLTGYSGARPKGGK